MKRNDLVKKLRESLVYHTNRKGYLDITEETMSEVLLDLENLIPIEYETETEDAQLEFVFTDKE